MIPIESAVASASLVIPLKPVPRRLDMIASPQPEISCDGLPYRIRTRRELVPRRRDAAMSPSDVAQPPCHVFGKRVRRTLSVITRTAPGAT